VSAFDATPQGSHAVTVAAMGTESGTSKQAETEVFVRGRPGSLDTTFGTNGFVTTSVGATSSSVNGLLVIEDDSIVAIGVASDAGGSHDGVALAKYTADGAPVTSFGSNGVLHDPKVATEYGVGAVDQGSKGVVVLSEMSPSKAKLRRYLPDGSIDPDFGFAGVAQMPAVTGFSARSLLAQGSGRLVVVGTALGPSGATHFTAIGFTEDGDVDASFADAGVIVTPSFDCESVQVALAPPGEIILVAGATYDCADSSNMQPMLVKLGANGGVDLGFGTDGKSLPI
jgi:uncharacterized delta-60 repeat protein